MHTLAILNCSKRVKVNELINSTFFYSYFSPLIPHETVTSAQSAHSSHCAINKSYCRVMVGAAMFLGTSISRMAVHWRSGVLQPWLFRALFISFTGVLMAWP